MHVDSVLVHVEDLCHRYEELASHPLSEDVKERVRAEIVQCTQRHRSQSQERLVAMDIGAVTQQTQEEWDH